MLRFILLFLIVILLASPVGAQDVHNPEPTKTEQNKAQEKPTPKNESASEPVADIEPSEKLDTNDTNNKSKGHQTDVQKTSLQDKDHKAQLWMNKAAWAQVALTALGVVLVWRTLVQTGKAAESAKNASDAAWEAVNVTKDSSERQLRAYITLENLGIMDNDYHLNNKPPVFYINIKNTGQTPAKNVKIYSQFGAKLADAEGDVKFLFGKHIKKEDVSPMTLGANLVFPIKADYRQNITAEQRQAMWDVAKYTCYCGVAIIYEDIFGKTRRTIIKAKMIKTDLGYQALPISKYNRAS